MLDGFADAERPLLDEVMAAWRSAFPVSSRRARMQERLRDAGVLEQPATPR